MKTLLRYLCVFVGIPLVAAGCVKRPAQAAPTPPVNPVVQSPAPRQTPAMASIPPPRHEDEPVSVTEAPRTDRVPNPLYQPGRTDSLDLTATLVREKPVTVSGKITFIITRETSHGKPVNIMNTALDLALPDGTHQQHEFQSVYAVQRDGSLKLLYKDSGSGPVWVESSTCPGEPRDYIEGHSEGCDVRFDDGSIRRTTSAVTRDGDNLKVITITKSTDKDGEHNSTDTYWLDIPTGKFIRYFGSTTGSDGIQMTLNGR